MSITFTPAVQVPMIFDNEPVMVWSFIDGTDELWVNMANSNACHVLSVLGYVGDIWDAAPMSAQDFLGRVLVAQGINPSDEGTVDEVSSGANGATYVACGRPEGYTDARLAQLRELAEYAVTVPDCYITWS